MHCPSGLFRPFIFLLPFLFFALFPQAKGQINEVEITTRMPEPTVTITPTVLYPGENVITITAPGGIRTVYLESGENELVEGYGAEIEKECATTATLRLRVNTASESVNPVLLIEPCDDSSPRPISLGLNTVWNLDEVPFPDVEPGVEMCRPFQIRLAGIGIGTPKTVLDSVSSPDDRVSFAFSAPPPVGIPHGTTYQYSVCFRADEPGTYRFPVITWIRRDQPAGGYTTYPVADTGVIRVVEGTHEMIIEELEFSSEESQINVTPVTIDPSAVDSVVLRSVDSVETEEDPGLTQRRVPLPTEPTQTPATLVVKTASFERGRE